MLPLGQPIQGAERKLYGCLYSTRQIMLLRHLLAHMTHIKTNAQRKIFFSGWNTQKPHLHPLGPLAFPTSVPTLSWLTATLFQHRFHPTAPKTHWSSSRLQVLLLMKHRAALLHNSFNLSWTSFHSSKRSDKGKHWKLVIGFTKRLWLESFLSSWWRYSLQPKFYCKNLNFIPISNFSPSS